MGIEFTRRRLGEADIVLFMVDCSEAVTEQDKNIVNMVKDRRAVLVINKTDLSPYEPTESTVERFAGLPSVKISALLNTGIDGLKDTVFSLVTNHSGSADLPSIVPNLRHKLALERALSAARTAAQGFRAGRPAELIAIDLKDALDALGEVIGVTTTEDILEQIFNRFCIGK
jgi:tRNA modification GTPase